VLVNEQLFELSDIGGPSGIGGALTSVREGVTTLINQMP